MPLDLIVVPQQQAQQQAEEFQQANQLPETNPQGGNWHPGNAPSQALTWAVQALAKAGTLSIIGVLDDIASFPWYGNEQEPDNQHGNCNTS